MDTNIANQKSNDETPPRGGAEPETHPRESGRVSDEAADVGDNASDASRPQQPSPVPAEATDSGDASGAAQSAQPSSAPGKKSLTPAQCALLSAFVYPGSGQLARGNKRRGWTIIALFSVFLIWWLIWLAMGALIVYRESSYVGIQYPEAIAEGMSYIKLSFIPGTAAAAIFIYSICDAYKS